MVWKSLGDWLGASVPCFQPLQPPVDWQFSIPLVPRIKGRYLEYSMLISFFSVLYLAEPGYETSSVSASLTTPRNSLDVKQITEIFFIKAG